MLFATVIQSFDPLGIPHVSLKPRRVVLALSTIKRMEASDGLLRGTAENVWKVERALENAGVAFIDESNELGPGVRLGKQKNG